MHGHGTLVHLILRLITIIFHIYLIAICDVSDSQSLINLLITGKAVSYVWDNIKEVSGLSESCLKLKSTLQDFNFKGS